MPKITAKSVYALAALYYLLQQPGGGPHTIEEIAKGAGVPKNFLEQILLSLKRAGILKSVRGARGGYILAKDPAAIRVLDVVEAVESECCSEICKTANPVLERFWRSFAAHVRSFLTRPITELEGP